MNDESMYDGITQANDNSSVRKEPTMTRLMRLAMTIVMLCGLMIAAAPMRVAHAAGGGLPKIWVDDPATVTLPVAANGAPRLTFSGEGFTVGGKVRVAVYRPGKEAGPPEDWYETTAGAYDGFEAGSFGLATPLYNCAGDSPVHGVPYTVYAYDYASQTWSSGIDIKACEGMVASDDTSGNTGQSTTGDSTASSSGPTIWISTYYYDPSASCNGDTCSSSSSGLIPRIEVDGDGFAQFGAITVGVYLPGTDTLVAKFDTATTYGNQIAVGTDLFDCTGETNGVAQYEIQAYDWTADAWSNTVPVTACTAVY
jgi:hypothetical protein